MRSKWEKVRLSELITIKHGYAFKGQYFVDKPTNDVLVTPGNFFIGGGFNNEKRKYYSGPIYDDFILKSDDIIVTMTDLSKDGDTLGYSAKVPNSDKIRYLHNQRIGLVNIVQNSVSKDFLYWLLRSQHYHAFIVNSSTGTTVKHTSPSRIGEFQFLLPSLSEQKKIANILSSFDDKIEVNNKITNILWSLISFSYQTIIRDPSCSQGKLSDISQFVSEKADCTEASVDSYIGTENIFPNKAGYTFAKSVPNTGKVTKFSSGDTLISNIRPYFKKIVFAETAGYCSNDVLCFRPKTTENS